MPMPYSHYVLAQAVAQQGNLQLQNKSDYYVGAFYPDIRYFTGLPRERYHFPTEQLEPYKSNPSVTPDFLLGYEVHLLIDEIWEYPEVKRAYDEAFPRLIRKRMTRGLQALAFELFCLSQPVEVIPLKPVENQLTHDLEVNASANEQAVQSMQRYLEQHDLAAALEMAKAANLFPEQRLHTVERVVKWMDNPLIRFVVNRITANASRPIFQRVVRETLERLKTTQKEAQRQSTTPEVSLKTR